MHYEEDRFHPNNVEDFDEVEEYEYNYVGNDAKSETTRASSINTVHKKAKTMFEDLKKIDKGYHKVNINDGRKKAAIEFYSTVMIPGAPIRDAITGAKFGNFLVGSIDEYQFFKVCYAGIGCNADASILFFVSPEQYEKHMLTTVDVATKSKWVDKSMEVRKRYQT